MGRDTRSPKPNKKTVVRSVASANNRAKVKYGLKLAKKNGANRVHRETKAGRFKYDVAGKAHKTKGSRVTTNTPHVTYQTRNPRSPHGWNKTAQATSMGRKDLCHSRRSIGKWKE